MKEILKNKALKVVILLVLIGLLFTNLGSILYYSVVGVLVILLGVIGWSFFSVVKENHFQKQ